jgi:hypothetical protein
MGVIKYPIRYSLISAKSSGLPTLRKLTLHDPSVPSTNSIVAEIDNSGAGKAEITVQENGAATAKIDAVAESISINDNTSILAEISSLTGRVKVQDTNTGITAQLDLATQKIEVAANEGPVAKMDLANLVISIYAPGGKQAKLDISGDGVIELTDGAGKTVSISLADMNAGATAQFRDIELLAWDAAAKKFIRVTQRVLAEAPSEPVDVMEGQMSKYIDCATGIVSDGGLAEGGGGI